MEHSLLHMFFLLYLHFQLALGTLLESGFDLVLSEFINLKHLSRNLLSV